MGIALAQRMYSLDFSCCMMDRTNTCTDCSTPNSSSRSSRSSSVETEFAEAEDNELNVNDKEDCVLNSLLCFIRGADKEHTTASESISVDFLHDLFRDGDYSDMAESEMLGKYGCSFYTSTL